MRIAIVVGLGLAASVASADGISTSIQIGKWTIESSECLWAGQRHTSYPIWKMFDGRPDTAWVFSGVGYPKLSPKDEGNGVEKGIRLKLVPSHPVVIDELRLMNGYNKSEDLYYKNSRVAEISIFDRYPSLYTEKGWVPRKPLRKVRLSDAMGMKSIALPKRAYGELWIVVTGIEKGPVDDLCISELMPRAGGRDLIPRGQAIQYWVGSDCGCSNTGAVFSPTGRKVVAFDHSERFIDSRSPDGRTLGVLESGDRLVVIDAKSSRVLAVKRLKPGANVEQMVWIDNRTVRLRTDGGILNLQVR